MEPAERRVCIVKSGGERMLGREAIVDRNDERTQFRGQLLQFTNGHLGLADDQSATMEMQDRRFVRALRRRIENDDPQFGVPVTARDEAVLRLHGRRRQRRRERGAADCLEIAHAEIERRDLFKDRAQFRIDQIDGRDTGKSERHGANVPDATWRSTEAH